MTGLIGHCGMLLASSQAGIVGNILSRPGLEGYWRMNEAPGATVLVDSSGAGRDGAIGSTVTLGKPSITPTDASTCHGFSSSAGAYHTVTHAAWQNPALVTYLCVFKAGTVGAYQHIFNKDLGGTTGHWIRVTNTGKIDASFRIAGLRQLLSATTVTPGNVYVVEAGYDGSSLRLFVNGVQEAAFAIINSLSAPTNDLQFGRNGATNFPFLGDMQHVALFSSAPTAARALATAQAAGLA